MAFAITKLHFGNLTTTTTNSHDPPHYCDIHGAMMGRRRTGDYSVHVLDSVSACTDEGDPRAQHVQRAVDIE